MYEMLVGFDIFRGQRGGGGGSSREFLTCVGFKFFQYIQIKLHWKWNVPSSLLPKENVSHIHPCIFTVTAKFNLMTKCTSFEKL